MRTLIVLLLLTLPAFAITADEAKNHMGEQATVCGAVASIHYSESGKGQPTFVNFDRPFPRQPFMLLIWGSDRYKFTMPDVGKSICVTGAIQEFRGMAEIVAHSPSQIKVQ